MAPHWRRHREVRPCSDYPATLGSHPLAHGGAADTDDMARRGQRIAILSTEHWNLLATRSLSWSESFSRASMFLTVLSGAVVALALVAQATGFGDGFTLFALLALPVVLFVGATTFVRLVEVNNEDVHWVYGMNLLRHAYLDMEPDLEPYFVSGSASDAAAIVKTYGPMAPARSGPRAHHDAGNHRLRQCHDRRHLGRHRPMELQMSMTPAFGLGAVIFLDRLRAPDLVQPLQRGRLPAGARTARPIGRRPGSHAQVAGRTWHSVIRVPICIIPRRWRSSATTTRSWAPRDASDEEIKRAFRRAAQRNHPDIDTSDGAEERFKELNEAYRVLSDRQRRTAYDMFGHAGVDGASGGGFEGFGGGFGPFGDIFDAFFGGSPAGTRGRRRVVAGADLRYDLTIDFGEAIAGVTRRSSSRR